MATGLSLLLLGLALLAARGLHSKPRPPPRHGRPCGRLRLGDQPPRAQRLAGGRARVHGCAVLRRGHRPAVVKQHETRVSLAFALEEVLVLMVCTGLVLEVSYFESGPGRGRGTYCGCCALREFLRIFPLGWWGEYPLKNRGARGSPGPASPFR